MGLVAFFVSSAIKRIGTMWDSKYRIIRYYPATREYELEHIKTGARKRVPAEDQQSTDDAALAITA